MPNLPKHPHPKSTYFFFQRCQPKLGARMKKLALLLNFTHIRKIPTNLTDFEKGRSPQEPNRNDVPPKPQQSNTKPNATTRDTNNVGLGFSLSRLLTKKNPTTPTPASLMNASSSGRISRTLQDARCDSNVFEEKIGCCSSCSNKPDFGYCLQTRITGGMVDCGTWHAVGPS